VWIVSNRTNLRSLLGSIPMYSGPRLEEQVEDLSFTANVPALPGYVWPDVGMRVTDDAQVLLISAPGAMGKSAAAIALAAALRAPYVDLSHLTVGSHTFLGLLTHVLGWDQAPEFIKNLRAGKTAVILDALDEAQLREGRDHSLAFLRNIAEIVAGTKAANQVIILGRPDAIETAELAFAEARVAARVITILPLDFNQANDLVFSTLDSKVFNGQPYSTHKTHSVPMRALFVEVVADIADALGANAKDGPEAFWSSVDDFLGYPPVLLVLAERLLVQNPAAELAELKSDKSRNSAKIAKGELLRKIVEGILNREQKKVARQISSVFGIQADDPKVSVIYSREEQCLRILERAVGVTLQITPPASLSTEERQRYEEQLRLFIPDHPFLVNRDFANVVFADYLRAYISVSPIVGVHGPDRSELLSSCKAPGPFLTHFIYALSVSPEHDLSEEIEGGHPYALPNASVDEGLVDDLIRSNFAAGRGEDDGFFYSHVDGQDHALLVLADPFEPTSLYSREGSYLSFRIENPSGILQLSSPLSHGLVISPGLVISGSANDEIELGPGLMLASREVEILGKKLFAISGANEANAYGIDGVYIVTRSIVHGKGFEISANPSESLGVAWSDMWHMWKPYAFDIVPIGVRPEVAADPDAVWSVTYGVRRILMSFSQAAAKDPTVHSGKMHNIIIGSNPFFQAVLSGLVVLGIVYGDRKNAYALNLGELGKYGIDYSTLRGGDFVDGVSGLMAKLLEIEEIQQITKRSDSDR
jgi:hypothetical protein